MSPSATSTHPPLVKQNGANSTRHGERLYPHVVDEAAMTNPERIFGIQPKSIDVSQGFTTVTMKDFAQAVNYTSHFIDQHLGHDDSSRTIAYVGLSDFRYFIFQVAAIKTSHAVFVFSPQNAPASTVELFNAIDCRTLFHAAPLSHTAEALAAKIPGLRTHAAPSLEDMLQCPAAHYPYRKTWQEAKDDVAIIVHTSGTTGAPKPIRYTNAFLGVYDSSYFLPPVDGREPITLARMADRACYIGFPIFHAGGVAYGCGSIFWGCRIVLGPAEAPMDPVAAMQVMQQIDVTLITLVPIVYEMLCKEYPGEFISASKSLKYIFWTGGPLKQSVGDWMRDNTNAMLCPVYGTTETGGLSLLTPPQDHWDSFTFHPYTGIKLDPLNPEDPNTLYEAVIVRQPKTAWVQGIFYTFPELSEWRTRDLFQKHETVPDAWDLKGRRDDVIVLSTGYKISALALETMVAAHPSVTSALLFGNGRSKCGLLVEADDEGTGKEVIEKLWPLIETSNATLSEQCKLQKDMIKVASPEKPFVRASKGTVIRAATEKLYEKEIELLYQTAS